MAHFNNNNNYNDKSEVSSIFHLPTLPTNVHIIGLNTKTFAFFPIGML